MDARERQNRLTGDWIDYLGGSMGERKIKNWAQLLFGISDALRFDILGRGGRQSIDTIRVTFYVGAHSSFEFSLAGALETLANDVYWDERGDWSDADRVTVGSF